MDLPRGFMDEGGYWFPNALADAIDFGTNHLVKWECPVPIRERAVEIWWESNKGLVIDFQNGPVVREPEYAFCSTEERARWAVSTIIRFFDEAGAGGGGSC